MMSMTHGHTRKYYDVLKNNPKLEWIAVSTANEDVKKIFLNSVDGIPCYDSDEAGQNAIFRAIEVAREMENAIPTMELKISYWAVAGVFRSSVEII